MRFWTYTLTGGSLQVNQSDYAMFISVQCDAVSGSCTIQGNIPFKGINPTSVAITAGQGVNLSTLTPASPLDGLTITHVSGNVDIVIGF